MRHEDTEVHNDKGDEGGENGGEGGAMSDL
jgi:hypothetical protein